ncbi:DUF4261 domain-containing protein, partial [Ancrocorticia sp.]
MSEQLPLSSLHPLAPEFLSTAALYTAPIDVDAAVARIGGLWNEQIDPKWNEIPAGALGKGSPAGRILQFEIDDVVVMVTPEGGQLPVEGGQLPEHSFYAAVSCYAPLREAAVAEPQSPADLPEVKRRKRMVSAHIVMTEVMDALMREEAAVGVFRSELGVVQPPEMVTELANSLTEGQAPLPLWVAVRIFHPDLVHGRTLGLPLFGHLDLEVLDSTHSEEDVFAMLANIADYIISSDSFLLPGQTIGYREDEELQITQEVSDADGQQVIRIQ